MKVIWLRYIEVMPCQFILLINVYEIGKEAFLGCSSLQSVVWNAKQLFRRIVKIGVEEDVKTHSDMDDLVSGDVDRTVRLFLPANSQFYDRVCGVAIRTVIRLISNSAYVKRAYFVDEYKVEKLALQKVDGDHKLCTGFAGAGDDLLVIADTYAQEEFGTVDLDALDAVGEFVNCINGLFASEMSHENISIDMLPPEFYDKGVTLSGKQFCVFPIVVQDKEISFILSVDSEFSVS